MGGFIGAPGSNPGGLIAGFLFLLNRTAEGPARCWCCGVGGWKAIKIHVLIIYYEDLLF
jgi:hypothetical protein